MTCTKSLVFFFWGGVIRARVTEFRKSKGESITHTHTHYKSELLCFIRISFPSKNYHSKDCSEMTVMLYTPELCGIVATTHMELVSTGNMPGVNEELNFLFI